MSQALISVLVVMLSGLPAAALVCDLVVCPEESKPPAAAAGCHDHARPSRGAQVEAVERCAHMAVLDLGVPPVPRFGSSLVAALAAAPVARDESATPRRVGVRFLTHAPPDPSRPALRRTLRI